MRVSGQQQQHQPQQQQQQQQPQQQQQQQGYAAPAQQQQYPHQPAPAAAAAPPPRQQYYDQSGNPITTPVWYTAIDPASRRTYWYNVMTGETSWTPPGPPMQPPPPPQPSAAAFAPSPAQTQAQTQQAVPQVDGGTTTTTAVSAPAAAFVPSPAGPAQAREGGEAELSAQQQPREAVAAQVPQQPAQQPAQASSFAKAAADVPSATQQTQPDEPAPQASSPPAPAADVIQAATTPKTSQAGSQDDLRAAVENMDATTLTTLLKSNPTLSMDEQTTDLAFWSVVNEVNRAEAADEPLSAEVPRMLHHIFDADLNHLLTREKIRTNLTCMMPAESGLTAHGMNYIFDDSSHKDLPLTEGRRCEDGNCCDECSRNIFPTFASEDETDLDNTFPELASLTFNELETVSAATILQFTRLIERVRRTIAYEYGLDLKTVLPLQAYSRKYVAGTTQQGGGGGEGDFVTLHTDEATHAGYHYSCVIYLSTQGKDFEGGDFVFNDPLPDDEKKDDDDDYDEELEAYGVSLAEQIRRAGRKFTPFHPTRGAAVIFSSGWENMHEVEKITSGVRYAVPCFFTTCPVPEAHFDQMVQGKPKSDEDIADDWLHLLLAHREETPMESMGRVKELLMKWHYMCAPLSEH